MNKRIKVATGIAALLAVVVGIAVSRPRVVCEGFLPENELQILEDDPSAAGITEAQFNSVLDKVDKHYTPIIAAQGGKLVINRLWSNGTVNASAIQYGADWHINMYGGLARHATITVDGFALVACHEIGHHLGGFPKMHWATNEGGADYFATLKCLRRLNGPDEKAEALDPVAAKACEGNFADEGERNRCGKGTMAGVSVANLFQVLAPRPTAPLLTTPDPTQVARTNDRHPAGQCRLDTYFQGSLCTRSIADDLANDNPVTGACTQVGGFTNGIRPRCWYKGPAGQEFDGANMARANLELPNVKELQRKLDTMRAVLSDRGI